MPENTRPAADGPDDPADLDPRKAEPEWTITDLDDGVDLDQPEQARNQIYGQGVAE